MTALRDKIEAAMPQVAADAGLYASAATAAKEGGSIDDMARRLARYALGQRNRDAVIAALAKHYLETRVLPDMAGHVEMKRDGQSDIAERGPGIHAAPAAPVETDGANHPVPASGPPAFAPSVSPIHDGRASSGIPNGHTGFARAVVNHNPPRSRLQTVRLVQAPEDREYFRSFTVRGTPIGEIRLGAAKTMKAQNEREAAVLGVCIRHAGGTDERMRIDEIVPAHILAQAIRSNTGRLAHV